MNRLLNKVGLKGGIFTPAHQWGRRATPPEMQSGVQIGEIITFKHQEFHEANVLGVVQSTKKRIYHDAN